MLELRSVSVRLGDFALSDVELALGAEEYFVILGPSGAGKTVLVEMIAGLVRPDSGAILWQGRDITAVPPERRGFAIVYQDYMLFPHLDVAGNIAYGLKAVGVDRAESGKRVRAMAETLGVVPLLGRDSETLSGGEKQKVALARALVTDPAMLLLDEPLAALDGVTRLRLRKELKRIHRRTGTPFLHVTHDAEEAMSLGDRIGVMLGNRIHQVATPEKLFRTPSDREVADFLGMRNVLEAVPRAGGVCETRGVRVHAASADDSTSHVWIKPEEIILSAQPFNSSARNQFKCVVVDWEHSNALIAVRVATGELALWALVTHASFGELEIQPGVELYATFKSSAVHCF